MIRRLIAIVCILMFVFAPAYAAAAPTVQPCSMVLGESATVRYFLPATGQASLTINTESGIEMLQVLSTRLMLGGNHELTLDAGFFEGKLNDGEYVLVLTFGDQTATAPFTVGHTQTVATAAVVNAGEPITPAYLSVYRPEHEDCYWCTPMDITDEEAVWNMLTAPVTVIDLGQKEQLILRAEPSNSSEGVGVITGASQAVHVIEKRSDGWLLVEAYSSSFHDSKVKNWNAFVSGYVHENRVKTVTPRTDYAMLVDKLTQRLYIFTEGKLMTTLLCSTGLANERQPYNETRSGEFLIVSRVGDFQSDNLICRMGLRFNSGDLIHEVPHVKLGDGTRSYKSCEPKLGERASHGCIRIQRRKNADGVNMSWLWNNIKTGTKFVVWEDYAGRQIPLPDDNITLYYNANGGSYYHSTDMCPGIRDHYLPLEGVLTYGQLDDAAYKELEMCPNCIPPQRRAVIEAINNVHLTESPGMIK